MRSTKYNGHSLQSLKMEYAAWWLTVGVTHIDVLHMQSISKWLDRSALIHKELGYPGE